MPLFVKYLMASKISVTIPDACQMTGLGRSTLYKLFKDPSVNITPRKVGTRTLILVAELEAYLNGLPNEAA